MANNFFLNNDPLLYSSLYQPQQQKEDNMEDIMNKYRILQQQQSAQDYVGKLDEMRKGLDESVITRLAANAEFQKLNAELEDIIRGEMLSTIKARVNMNQTAVKNIEQQIQIIKGVGSQLETEQRQSLNEINDYIKNYSNITFDEYKKIKAKEGNTNEN